MLNVIAVILGVLGVLLVLAAATLGHPGALSGFQIFVGLLTYTAIGPFLWFLLVLLGSSDPERKGAALAAAFVAVAVNIAVMVVLVAPMEHLFSSGPIRELAYGIALFVQVVVVVAYHARWARQDRWKEPRKPLGRGV
jgi:hypothetical protein